MRVTRPVLLCALCVLVGSAFADRAADDAVGKLRGFLVRLKQHDVDLYVPLETGIASPTGDGGGTEMRYYRSEEVEQLTGLLESVAATGHPDAPLVLSQCAVFRLEKNPVLERRLWRAEQPWLVRRLAADSLVECTNESTDEWLAQMLLTDRSARDGAAKRELGARTLARRGAVKSAPKIAGLLHDEAPSVRACAARALGELGVPSTTESLLPGLADDDATVRLETLVALDRLAQPDFIGVHRAEVLKAARAALEDPHWTVRLAAASLLGTLRDKSSVPALIRALEREQPALPGARHRVRTALRDSLGALTGEDFASFQPEEWSTWWTSVSADFELAVDAKPVAVEQGSRFFGIPIDADEVVFLIDVSGSMRQPVKGDPSGPDRYTVAVRELERCLQGLPRGTRFNVVLFNESLLPFAKRPVAVDDASVESVSKFIRGVTPSGGTDLFGALEFGFGLDADRALDSKLGSDADTIVLLTDGVPSRGAILVQEQIRYEVGEANRARHVAVHTVDTGGVATGFLADLAHENHGEATALGR